MHNKYKLKNGIKIVIDYIPYSSTVSIGFWVNVGSRDEIDGQHGYSHLIEHMLFKGTKNRSYLDIAIQIDELGGEINGATAKEFTYYYVNVAKRYFDRAAEILSDMFFNPIFNEDEFIKEKEVIINELDSVKDDPEEFINDLFSTTLWGKTSFGYPVIGTRSDIESSTLKKLYKYYEMYYAPENLIISVVGGLKDEEVISILEDKISPQKRNHIKNIRPKPNVFYDRAFNSRDIEQIYFIMGCDSYSYVDHNRYPMILLNSIIGGSFSSILFQEIREKRGLCYSISSSYLTYSDIGEFSIGFSTSQKNIFSVLELINKIIGDIKKGMIKKEDLDRAKKKFYGNFILASESNEWLMSRLAINEMVFGKIFSFEEVMKKVDMIELDDIYSIIDNTFNDRKFAIASIGPESTMNKLKNFNFDF